MTDERKQKTELQILTHWVHVRECYLNMSAIARQIDLDVSEFRKAVKGLPNSKGSIAKIPDRCLPALRDVIFRLNEKPE